MTDRVAIAGNGHVTTWVIDNNLQGGPLLSSVNWTVMQFTGLLDKNGKEIYEGDIVKVIDHGEETIHSVQYGIESDYPAFCLDPDMEIECNDLQYCVVGSDVTIEVIGNIYENPEILTGAIH